jgi:PIN domain nuclease of toxin-antitoxin system
MSLRRRYFCDTSAILKLYHNEIGSVWMEQLFNDQSVSLVTGTPALRRLF